ncbi:AraC family transcriptional regulator [Evansella sp. AB-rgal1]|uniref:AraC family transcriptional regulator n=1 Tax=Evansella sp. AB-rgal1 TaxID=3242696 RepID=UPI00359D03CF
MQNVVIFDRDYLAGKAMESIVGKNKNYQLVAVTKTVHQLFSILYKNKIDLLFVDVTYTDVPDFELLQILQQEHKSTSVVIVSSYNDYEYMRKTLKYGVQDYLVKPITIAKVNEVLEERQTSFDTSVKVMEVIRNLVMNKNFGEVYYSLESLQQLLEKEVGQTNDKQSLVESMSKEIFRLINCTEKENQDYLYKKLKFDEISFQDKFPTQFFLFTMFDEIYKQRTIQKKPQLSTLFSFVDKHIYDDLSLNDTAENCHISQGYLSRIFKENYNQGFNTYIQMKKMQLAKQGFFYNDSKIIDISFQLSYSEPSYFCKVFKKIEKITPNQLKKEMIKQS